VKPVYGHVILPLKALVEGEFFNEYIKKGNVTLNFSVSSNTSISSFKFPRDVLIWISGNILMLSEGRAGVDNVYTLKEGMDVINLVSDWIG
jgi:ribonuclease P/MRP protein subunit RPP40